MTPDESKEIHAFEHDEAIKLIPWYVKGKLNANEHASVKLHVENCEKCRSEVMLCQTISNSMPAAAETWKPSAAHFANILAEVDKLESVHGSAGERKNARHRISKGLFDRFKATFAATPAPMRWTVVFETLAIAGLVAIAFLPVQFSIIQNPAYETLSDAIKPQTTKGMLVKLVFADDMTVKELNSLFSKNGMQLREGPSAVGVYVAETLSPDTEALLATLKSHPKVRLVLLTTSPDNTAPSP